MIAVLNRRIRDDGFRNGSGKIKSIIIGLSDEVIKTYDLYQPGRITDETYWIHGFRFLFWYSWKSVLGGSPWEYGGLEKY